MSRHIRSRGLLALSVSLMAASGTLAYVLEHDAVGAAPVLSRSEPGSRVAVKGILEPFLPKAASAREAAAWSEVARHLDNFTYVVDTGDAQTAVLVTSPTAGPSPGTAVVTEGPVVLRTGHPDGSGRALLVVEARDLESPILFR